MALIALASASGAPGVTTGALALALSWPRPVLLIEADPAGSSQISAGYLRGQVPHNRGMIDLAVAHRQGRLAQTLREVAIELPARQRAPERATSMVGATEAETSTDIKLVAGARSHAQAMTVARIWDSLDPVLKSLERTGVDVIVDTGRLGMTGFATPLLRNADAALLTTRTALPALSGAHGWARQLRDEFERTGALPNLGLLLVGEGRPYSAKRVQTVLQLPVVASLAFDPVSAEVYQLGSPCRRRFDHAALPRSAKAAASAISTLISANRGRLAAS